MILAPPAQSPPFREGLPSRQGVADFGNRFSTDGVNFTVENRIAKVFVGWVERIWRKMRSISYAVHTLKLLSKCNGGAKPNVFETFR